MKPLALIALLPVSTLACGINVHTASLHAKPGFNAVTLGAGIVCPTEKEDLNWTMGAYRNSINRVSPYAGFTWEPVHLGRARAGMFLGVVGGYPGGAQPFIGGLFSFPFRDNIRGHIILTPATSKQDAAAVSFSIEYRF